MHKATSFIVLMVSAMVLFMVSAHAVQENNTTSEEKISPLNNTAVNNTCTNITCGNFTATNNTAINNTTAIKTAVSGNIASVNNTSSNNTAFGEGNKAANQNNTAGPSVKELGENESKSSYDTEAYSTIKPPSNVSAHSNIGGPFNVGDNLAPNSVGIGTTAKSTLGVSENASSEHVFDLGLPSKPVVDTSKFPFMCNIV